MEFLTPHHIRDLALEPLPIRPDAAAKLGGNPGFLSDRIQPGQLRGAILGSPHPHARILRIDTSAAKALAGVHAVVTHADIPGFKYYGLRKVDRPVLCIDKVRHVGDPVAAVAAVDMETARQALALIRVEYELLPSVCDPVAALDGTVAAEQPVHQDGNLLHAASHRQGDMSAAQAGTVHRVQDQYVTPRQMHAFLETEGGVAEPDGTGGLRLFFGGHNPAREKQVIADMLGLAHDRVHAVGTPVGGSYGGKDELTIQPIAALLAWKTQRPVRLHLTRPQSVDLGVKRHPMQIAMQTGCDAQGRLTYHQVQIVADTGAYATHGPEVLDAALEHAPGPYRYQALDLSARLAYTNNGIAGAFRGFGAVQVQFALEQQMDRLAALVGMTADAFRTLNLSAPEAPGPLGQHVVPFDGAQRALDVARQQALWRGPHRWASADGRHLHGVGLTLIHRSDGFGKGGPSDCRMELALAADGAIELRCGFTELGQNLVGTIQSLGARYLGCAADAIRPVLGDTRLTPDSGPVAASRATTLVWRALQQAVQPWQQALLLAAARLRPDIPLRCGARGLESDAGLCLSYADLAKASGEQAPCISIDLRAEDPEGNAHDTHFVFGACAAIAQVRIDTWSGMVQVQRLVMCAALGPVASAQGYLGQMEGGALMGLAMGTQEELACLDGRYQARNLDGYLIPTLADAPNMQVLAIENLPEGDPIGPRGAGEISVNLALPAVANALAAALQHPITQLPMTPKRVIALLEAGAEPFTP
ncbi:molybdopterin-dependent oxidoreductase [Comamonas testosteroni]|uniref:xanthine dehydrogenase family protein molybdopterin-binding subunit n=1 Tax=Comamonas testosteroni TaxID=285 RepID=UPI00265F7465|nr:molybdopterin cofactor-binding domain-containing protein [Comamonas testosteroni]WKL17002.1 molybdopterin-dependent oxidoreductase [Comamonas testosteroni]